MNYADARMKTIGNQTGARRFGVVLILFFLPLATPTRAQAVPPQKAPEAGLPSILKYIASSWDTLTRSLGDCHTVVDPKLAEASVLYLPSQYPEPEVVRETAERCKIQVKELPAIITGPGQVKTTLNPPGLLYLENKYVVPGGRFNEMYGWDSYFIVRGLLEDGRVEQAREMVENFFFEIEHYGTILNANRTYYLTRSQPPFLTSMILGVYEAQKAKGKDEREWLEKGYRYASRDYEMWNGDPHLAGDTGLARYYDFGEGPAPESLKDEKDFYRLVANYFLLHGVGGTYVVETAPAKSDVPVAGQDYTMEVCDVARTMVHPSCEPSHKVALIADYYKGDRAMRESGFDISFRFGPYGAATHHYAPVCLNSLLYKTEKDLQRMSEMLGHKEDAKKWEQAARTRKERIERYLWDEQKGMFFDYNVDTKSRSGYNYITTFYPLWAGIVTDEQARAVVKNLRLFEHPGGLAMSDSDRGVQWELPYGWAPTELIAIEGLRRYGFDEDANRTSYEFLSTVMENFQHDGTIREKYNVVTRSSETPVAAGYNINVVGFGWTNAAFLALLHAMPQEWQQRLRENKAPVSAH
jgi:alpha,alpha-trehalase